MVAVRSMLVAFVSVSLLLVSALGPDRVQAQSLAGQGSISAHQPDILVHGVITGISAIPIPLARVRVVSMASGVVHRTTTTAGGSFSVAMKVSPTSHGDSRFLIDASAPGYFTKTAVNRVNQSQNGTVRLRLAPDHGILAGTVRLPSGKPVAGARVKLTSEATAATAVTLSDRSGAFTVPTPALPGPDATNQFLVRATFGAKSWNSLLRIPQGSTTHSTPILRSSQIGRAHGLAPSTRGRAIRATPVPSCPATGSTTWIGSAGGGTWEAPGNWSNGSPGSTIYACVPAGAATITVNSAARAAGPSLAAGDSVDVQTGSLSLVAAGTPSVLEGSLTVGSGATVNIGTNARILNATGGSVVNEGSFLVAGSFEQNEGVRGLRYLLRLW